MFYKKDRTIKDEGIKNSLVVKKFFPKIFIMVFS